MPGRLFPREGIDRELLRDILSYVRIDGPLDAPICFLTMEDGGGFKAEDLATRDKFKESFKENDPHHVPEQGEYEKKCTEENMALIGIIGQLGIRIAKVMAALLGIEDYREYAKRSLYTRHETNVKFYPISFSTADGGDPEIKAKIEEFLGLSIAEYRDICRGHRTVLFKGNSSMFSSDKFYISSCSEWMEVLRSIFPEISYLNTYTDPGWNYQIYFDQNGVARFANFNLLKRSISDETIRIFSSAVLDHADESIVGALLRQSNS